MHFSLVEGGVKVLHKLKKSMKSKGSEKSGNCVSDDGENNASNGLNVGDGSDDRSGAQVVHI